MMSPLLKLRRVGAVETPRPRYAREGDSGLDLHAAIRPGIQVRLADGRQGVSVFQDELRIANGGSACIPCGWAFEIPHGFEGQVRPRSSSSARRIHIPLGTIDANYRGEVSFIVENRTGDTLVIRSGDRLAQLVIAPVATVEIEEVEDLTATERGEAGWGSTGG